MGGAGRMPLLALVALDRLARSRERLERVFRGLALPVGLLLVVTLAVDYWARAPGTGPVANRAKATEATPAHVTPIGHVGR